MARAALWIAVLVGLMGLSCSAWRAARLYQDGTSAIDRGDVVRAISDLERAARLAPRASEVRNHLGLAYLAAGNPVAARQSFERAIALDCENQAARRNLQKVESERAEEP